MTVYGKNLATHSVYGKKSATLVKSKSYDQTQLALEVVMCALSNNLAYFKC